eukprot:2105316-Prymnesium_polylepis.1
MSLPQQLSQFKYLVHVEGNGGWADRLRHALLSGALVMKQDMGVTEWYEPLVEPWKHFVPVSSTLHNLSDAVQWARAHDRQAAAMASASADLVEQALSEPAVVYYQSELFRRYAGLWRHRSTRVAQPEAGHTRAEFRCRFAPATGDRGVLNGSQFTARECFFVDEATGRVALSVEQIDHPARTADPG